MVLNILNKVIKIKKKGIIYLLWGGAILYNILYGNLFYNIKLIYNGALH